MRTICRKYPQLQGFFDFPDFNLIQKDCLGKIMDSNNNLIVSAPTSSGKTVLFEMAILKYSDLPSPVCLYLAPIKSLCHEKYNQWNAKFHSKLSICEVTGDSIENSTDKFIQSHITIGTPQKVDFLSRQSLEFLKSIKLLLIDEIHMLNFEERGATLEAIVSRIMSLNSKVRIVAVSATIPNIYEVAEWLKVPAPSICIYGDEYRPVKIKKVVLGFNNTGNPFTFEGSLNYKLLEVVRSYSEGKGSLIFCPTQKGTEAACRQIINQMKERQFIQNDKQLISLIQGAKQVANSSLQTMLPQGIAFHNASLSLQDRSIVQRLFLDLKIKVLCTTSTLSMGINLPARLVVIKSTQCYRGSMKGYQQYTRIEVDQMMGRAGRPPFDTEGTVVIMTEKSNYNRYNSQLDLENLESQLFGQFLEHLNAEISLGSITSLNDVQDYFHNSFCYIRMKKSPKTYGVVGNLSDFVKSSCRKSVQTLHQLNIINFFLDSEKLSPRPLSNSISRSAVQIKSIESISKNANEIVSQRQFLMALCRCEEVGRYTSKVEERKTLKELNERNKFAIKEAISNCQRKSFVLMQTELSRRHIDFWELRRQASQILQLIRRLNYCVKVLGLEIKHFWLYYWSVRYQKYFSEKFWEQAEGQIIMQLPGLQDKGKLLVARGIKSVSDLKKNLESLGTWLQKGQKFVTAIVDQLHLAQECLNITANRDRQTDIIYLKVTYTAQFNGKMRGITVCIGDSHNNLYYHRYLNDNNKEVIFTFPKSSAEEYKVGIIKDGLIGFDEFYLLKGDNLSKFNIEQIELKPVANRKSVETIKNRDSSIRERKSKSHQFADKPQKEKLPPKRQKTLKNRQSLSPSQISRAITNIPEMHEIKEIKRSKQLQLPTSYKLRQPLETYVFEDENQLSKKRIKKDEQFRYKPLNEYKWKPGFEQIHSQDSGQDHKKIRKSLKLVDNESKEKNLFKIDPKLKKIPISAIKPDTSFKQRDLFAEFQHKPEPQQSAARIKPKQQSQQDVFAYFYNLF